MTIKKVAVPASLHLVVDVDMGAKSGDKLGIHQGCRFLS